MSEIAKKYYGTVRSMLEKSGVMDESVRHRLARVISEELAEKNGWQPMDSAPRDGTYILVAAPSVGELPLIARFRAMEWRTPDLIPLREYDAPTKWMPLPAVN